MIFIDGAHAYKYTYFSNMFVIVSLSSIIIFVTNERAEEQMAGDHILGSSELLKSLDFGHVTEAHWGSVLLIKRKNWEHYFLHFYNCMIFVLMKTETMKLWGNS